MAILNIQLISTGQPNAPTIVFIETNNTFAEVTATGFLNSVVSQGFALSETQMALVSTKTSPNSPDSQTRFLNVDYSNGSWSLVQNHSSGDAWLIGGNELPFELQPTILGATTNQSVSLRANNTQYIEFNTLSNSLILDAPTVRAPNIGTGVGVNIVYFDTGTGSFTWGAAGGAGSGWLLDGTNSGAGLKLGTNSADGFDLQVNGSTFCAIDSVGLSTWSGGAQFNSLFNVSSADVILIQSLENVTVQALAIGKQLQLYGDSVNLVGTDFININSNNNNVNINANSGQLNGHGATVVLSADTSFNMFTSNGGFQVNTANGDFQLFAGTGPTTGQLSLAAQDQVNIFSVSQTVNINANDPVNGTVSINGAAGNWSAGVAGIAGGVSAGSGCLIDSITGNVQFGASVGTVLIGALANTMDVVSGTVLTLSGGTQLDIVSADVRMSLLSDQAPVVAAPTISLPIGFKYVICDDATNQLYKMG